ncbi:hypothetical protein ACIOC2_24330 [Streptomyces sp. NPDC088337]|uniref:Rv1733c family protein n=1 Tax=unclassified Streptomyces TaxID=2593676 RepID=UPI002DDBE933|nr:hypothetical protein [Streptomyces sp. NBC_01788]WSB25316.1 hypothetical protein OIE49_05185 [Streptomyces sp. NBC_01788]
MRAIAGLWRWRHNPLRRGTDLAEAWVALVALLLVLVAAPVVGCVVGFLAQDALQQSVREQGSSRHPVTARVVQRLNRLDPDPEITTGRDPRSRVLADWTAPDGTRRHGPVTTTLRSPRPGDHFTLWTDEHGRTVTRPLDSTTATTHAVLAGCGAGMLTALLVEGIRRLIVWRLDRRRDALWDQAWDRAGPDWGRTGTGS